MTTDDLIASLSENVSPVGRHAVGYRLAVGIVAGATVSIVLLAATLGFRPDLWLAMQGPAFWMKTAYTLSLAVVAIHATAELARPDRRRPSQAWLLALPALCLGAIGAAELSAVPRGDWRAMWLGATWDKCPWLILALAAPILGGLLWSFRRMAPTRLRAAGAVAGLAAGSFSAAVYCLHCPEVSAVFVLTWYSLGILLTAALGAALGPRLLRW